MSDDPTREMDSAEAGVTAPVEQVPVAASAPAAVQPVDAPAAAHKRITNVHVFAVAAAIVLALGLSAVSFGAGVFVGRHTVRAGFEQGIVGGPGMGFGMRGNFDGNFGGRQQMQVPNGVAPGMPGQRGDGYGRGPGGRMRGQFDPSQLPTTTVPNAQ